MNRCTLLKRLSAMALAALMLISLCACQAKPQTNSPSDVERENVTIEAIPETQAPETQAPETQETEVPVLETVIPELPDQEIDTELPVRVITLNGTTGFGMAGLISEAGEGKASLNYTFTVETDASNATAALVSGDCDIAALPTNAASALYNKTEGQVQVLALNTLGVLYVVTNGSVEVNSFADLAGMTVYVPAQNPTFIFRYLCQANNVDVTIDNTYAQPAELLTAVAANEAAVAVLPEPMVTVAKAQNENVAVALDLTAEWDQVSVPGSLVQGCVAVRRAFAEEHPAEVSAFLDDYCASIALLNTDPETAAAKIEAAGIYPKAAVAAKAIPNCNVCFITGADMQIRLSAFLQTMYETEPASIGGAVPGDDFYCILD